jgi:pimeloyl-ACP methyl ester carboxylesterase
MMHAERTISSTSQFRVIPVKARWLLLFLPYPRTRLVFLNLLVAGGAVAAPDGGLSAPQIRSPSIAQIQSPAAVLDYRVLSGAMQGTVTPHDAMMLNAHVPMLVDRLKQNGQVVPVAVEPLLGAAEEAYRNGDCYRSYRLYARAAGLARGAENMEASEVAASLKLSLNRAIFADRETITLTLHPLFNLGHPLAKHYTAISWLETEQTGIVGTVQLRVITSLTDCRFDYPTAPLPNGVVAVGYRLTSASGETLAEIRQPVVVAKDAPARLEQLKARWAVLRPPGSANESPAMMTALATIEYVLHSFELERSAFDGNWQRAAHPFGMYLGHVNFVATGREIDGQFPAPNARLRYPEDIDLAESLVEAIGATPADALLKESGDLALAFRPPNGSDLQHFRLFVPDEIGAPGKNTLIVALHSGAGDASYFEWEHFFARCGEHPENQLKQLAQERGFIVVCPNGTGSGFLGDSDFPDIMALVENMRRIYGVEPSRVFVTGWSAGASAVWQLALQHPESFGAAAPVGGAADWLNKGDVEKAAALPVLYSVPQTEAAEAQKTEGLATRLLRNFHYVEYPKSNHMSVWAQALPSVFDFFDACIARSDASRKLASTSR